MHRVPMPPTRLTKGITEDCMKLKEPGGLEVDFGANGYFGCSNGAFFNPPLLPRVCSSGDKITGYIPLEKGDVYLGFIDTDDNTLYIVHLRVKDSCS